MAKNRDVALEDGIAEFVGLCLSPGPTLNRARDVLLALMARELVDQRTGKGKRSSILEENRRLKWAIAWAEGRDVPGVEPFQARQEGQPAYWWRSTMGRIASGEIEVA